MMLLNPDTQTHNELNRWFFSTEIDELLPEISEVARRLSPELNRIIEADSRWGMQLVVDQNRTHEIALLTVLELLLGTLDPQLSQSSIGKQFKLKLSLVSEALGLPKVPLSVREASEENLMRWFSGSQPISNV